jgi:hypothetical protein
MFKQESIHYDAEQNQWFVKQGNRSYRLHCGEYFKLLLGKTALDCRLELDAGGWYVILTETKFILHPRAVYTVKM